ncbi:heme NO-binding domain-containing protein [Erythrobacter sp. EC-HK427]|uniref:heme NO-binding domain-containing protein n=1 Tax=Erythrobacter sp. EC-HK427 TaxID=2038396 RepID=UPI001254A429|nr:heme NO-binding domain-containing protein [Erythrobacter sp. EC-HK427]VVT04379.1 Guanylate cyclase [Erythrobacter sp. EC-HK427]
MKGVIFTELVGFMEEIAGVVFADQVLMEADLPHGGAYSAVGSYPSAEALSLVTIASEKSGIPAGELCDQYGRYLFDRFNVLFPDIMKLYATVDALLDHVGPHIHEEVRVLYPGAQPPSVTTQHDGDVMTVTYESHRPMAHIAHGLIARSIEHYGDPRRLEWEANDEGTRATFTLRHPA